MSAVITTVDNPYDPREDFLKWNAWDVAHGYNTASYLARVSSVADDAPEVVRDRQLEEAIDEIIEMHNGEIYKKLFVEAPDAEPEIHLGEAV